MKGILGIYFCNCTFYAQSQFFFIFSDDSLNHNYIILSDIIINILKLMVEYILFPLFII